MVKRQVGVYEKPFQGLLDDNNSLQVGFIIFVDYERKKCSVQTLSGAQYDEVIWLDGKGSRSGHRHIPEFGDAVLLGNLIQGSQFNKPVILGFVEFGVESQKGFKRQDSALYDLFTLNMRSPKLYDGDWAAGSSQGAETQLDGDWGVAVNNGCEKFLCREEGLDATIALSRVLQTSAGIIRTGLVFRSEYGDTDKAMVLRDGHRWYVITQNQFSSTMDAGGIPWVEHRHEIPETSKGRVLATEFNSGHNTDIITPLVIYVRGTVVGNDPSEASLYGKVIKTRIFTSWAASSASVADEAAASSAEETTKALCLREKFSSGTQRGITKAGKLVENYQVDDVGVSVERNLVGARKEVIGKETSKGESERKNLAGGMHIVVGKDNDGNSCVKIFEGGAEVTISGPNDDGYALNANITGKVKVNITGDVDLDVDGDVDADVTGEMDVRAQQDINIRSSQTLNLSARTGVNINSLDGSTSIMHSTGVLTIQGDTTVNVIGNPVNINS